MKFHSKDIFSGIFFLFSGLFLGYLSLRLSIWSKFGPDEGFFPLVVALIIIGVSLIIILKAFHLNRIKREENRFHQEQGEQTSTFRVCSYVLLILLYGVLFEGVGFLITSTLFLILILKYVERQGWLTTIFLGIGSIIISYILFVYLLGVFLPHGLIKW